MPRKTFLAAAALAAILAPALCTPAAWAQSAPPHRGVITPPPTKPDGSVITPPEKHTDPGIQKTPEPGVNQGQLPKDAPLDAPKAGDAPKPSGPTGLDTSPHPTGPGTSASPMR